MAARRGVSAVALAVLGVLTAVLVVLAWLHGSPRQPVPGAPPPTPKASASADTPTPQGSVTPSASPPGESTEPSAAEQWSEVRRQWQSDEGELDVLVLGDESGAGEAGWVQLLAESAAQDRPVTYQPWSAEEGEFGKIALGDGSGAPLTLHNVSLTEGTAAPSDEATRAYGDLDPDIVVLNYGHHEDGDDIADSFDALVDTLPGNPSVVALMQNPHATEDGQREIALAVRAWGKDTHTPVVNVFAAFAADDRGVAPLLDEGGVLPNWDGSMLWAAHVLDELERDG